jgi:hypothetical protein
LEIALICAIAWTPVEELNVNTQIFGAIQGSSGDQLSTVHAVTAYDRSTLGTILLGPDNGKSRTNQVITKFTRSEIQLSHNMTERDDGQQLVQVKDLTIKLSFEDQARLAFEPRKPTTTKLASLKIYWMIHKIPDKHSQLLRHSQRRIASTIPEPVPWEERLDNCP